jgi:hypothetical protein
MIRYLYSALALATLTGSISAKTIFEQTQQNVHVTATGYQIQHNCHVTATDYKDTEDTVLIGNWKASDFYAYGMNPITITVANKGTEDIEINGAAVRESNQAGIVDNVLLKPWYNKALVIGLELGTMLPGLYVGLNQCILGAKSIANANGGILRLLFGGLIIANSGSVITALLSGLYIAKSVSTAKGIAIMGAILGSHVAQRLWINSFEKEFKRQVLMATDSLVIKPGQSMSKIIIVSTAYPVLNLPVTDIVGTIRVKTNTVAIRLLA